MITIQKPHPLTAGLLGKPERKPGESYRLTHFLLRRETDEGVLLYNTLSCELLFLTKEEEAAALSSDELIARSFVVPPEHNEHELAASIRSLMRKAIRPGKIITSYYVFTTMSCNARCPYCFEKGMKGGTMTEETAKKAARYMAEHSGGKTLLLYWFGGEPLCNTGAMDVISRELTALGVDFKSYIFTNGYLLDDAAVERSLTLWRVKTVQVTLDGTEEVYNRTKAYVGAKNGSPFRTVLSNVERMLDKDLRVKLRLNIGPDNGEELADLIDLLNERFHGRKNLEIGTHLLFELAEADKALRDRVVAQNDVLRRKIRAADLGYRDNCAPLPNIMRVSNCQVDNGTGCSLLPDGTIALCENSGEQSAVGTLDGKAWDMNRVAVLAKPVDEQPACVTCALYPQCRLVEHCVEHHCFENEKQYRIEELSGAMAEAYRAFPATTSEKAETAPSKASKRESRAQLRFCSDFVYEEFDGLYAVVPVSDEGRLADKLLRLDETGLAILEHLRQDISREELIRSLAEEYDAPEDEVSEDVDAFLAVLDAEGLLV